MTKERPVNLNLTTIRFPVTAIISILHRISGILLFLSIPFFLCLLSYSLSSPEHFKHIGLIMTSFWVRLLTWAILSALIYHFVAGFRHLLMDIGIGESLKGGRCGAWLVLLISVILIVFAALFILFGFNQFIF